MEKPLVSIRCTVYNHEPYLRQCLDGFVMQKTNFPFEAIVHDDASTDHSADIIREYASKYPNIIKPIYETENQYSKGGNTLTKIMFNACKGKYIAYCEGDDYWTDLTKLQRQVDFLETHKDYIATTENAIILYTDTGQKRNFSEEAEQDISLKQLVVHRRFPTASVMVRSKAFGDDYFDMKYHYDTITWCYFATKGKIKYFPVVSSVYRRGSGITSTTEPYKWALLVEKWDTELNRVIGKQLDDTHLIDNIMARQFVTSGYASLQKRTGNFLKCIQKAYSYNRIYAITKGSYSLLKYIIWRLIR